VSEERLEIVAVAGGEGRFRHDGRGGDHGIHTQPAASFDRVEKARRSLGVRLLERDDASFEKSPRNPDTVHLGRMTQAWIFDFRRCFEKGSNAELFRR
jgi:hypothetical protein